VRLQTDLDAFYTDHRLCGDLEAGVDGVWIARDCGGSVARRAARATLPAAIELDARGRRLRAALAAVFVKADARRLRGSSGY
jgi:hypothetical protein